MPFLLISLPPMAGAQTSSPHWLRIGFSSRSGGEWFNQDGRREKEEVYLVERRISLDLHFTIYKKFFVEYESSMVWRKGKSSFYFLAGNRMLPATTGEIKSHGPGDSTASAGIKIGKFTHKISLEIPSGSSDFSYLQYPLGTGRWGISLEENVQFFLLTNNQLSLKFIHLFPRDYTYVDYLGNVLPFRMDAKEKFFLIYSIIFNRRAATFNPGINYYHEFALSKENLLILFLQILIRAGGSGSIIAGVELPIYGKYYPSQMYPSFFWLNEYPIGKKIYLRWRYIL